MRLLPSLHQLSNSALLEETVRLAAGERTATAVLVAAIGEVDARRLYLGESCPSMFVYCTRVLHLSEHAAYDRIEAARIARRFPLVLDQLANGTLTLTNLRLLAPHLSTENVEALLQEAAQKSKQDVEQLIVRFRPQPAVASSVRKLPDFSNPSRQPGTAAPQPTGSVSSTVVVQPSPPPPKHPVVEPLAPERYKVQFTISTETCEKLRRVQDLMRHKIPNGDVAAIFDRALSLLLEDLERSKVGATKRPRKVRAPHRGSRHVPAGVRREVWRRDGGRCAFVGANGRCTETGFLEFHHVRPHAVGGMAVVDNIELRCRAHNVFEAELFFGETMPRQVRETGLAWPVETGPETSSM